ncbi:MAG: multidrug efflux RND transporter permease subunit [Bryobacterales bacterium]|nr:multidrug efflux RND transporter permease subunit [Bryobacterales bacterium]
MAKFFIDRPVFAIVVSLVILIAGGLSMLNLPVAQYPPIAPPTVSVQVTYPGASAETVEQSIATAIEQEVNGAENMIYMSSKSSSDGRYTLQVTFAVGTNIDLASVDVNNRVKKAVAKLPAEAVNAGVTVKKQSPDMLMIISVYSPDGSYDDTFLSNYATINLVDAITRTPGVGRTNIGGQRDYAMRLWLQPDAIARLGLTAMDLVKAVRDQNVLAPAGTLGAPPAPPGLPFQYTLDVKGRLSKTPEFENLIVRTLPDGSIVRMRDLARAELAAATYSNFGRRDGVPSSLIIVYQVPGANSIETADRLHEIMAQLGARMPAGVKYDITYDATKFVRAAIDGVLHALRDAVLLVLLVVFLFLGSFRATLIPMLAVPISLLGTFAVFLPLGFSINTLTLFAIVLAVGIVVDDAIVVVEAVQHHIEHGLSPYEATVRAMEEVSGPVVAIALVLCAVFVPVAFMGGITGQLYRQFALTLSVAVLLSALVALSLTPALCCLILKPHKEMGGPIGALVRGFRKVLDRLTGGYVGVVSILVRRLAIGIVALVVLSAASGGIAKFLPTGFVPFEDQGALFCVLTLPDGASLERTDALARRAETDFQKIPGVEHVLTFGGLNLISGTYSSNCATFIVVLKPWEERKSKETRLPSLVPRVRQLLNSYPEALSVVAVPPPIPGLGASGGFQFEIQDRGGHTARDLYVVSQQFLDQLSSRPEVVNTYSNYRTDVPQVELDIDRDKAKTLGVRIDSIFQTLQIYLGGYQVNDFNLFGKTYKVMLQAEEQYRENPNQILSLYTRTGEGDMVPLSTLASIGKKTGPDVIQRYNMFRTAEIGGASALRYSTGQTIEALEGLARDVLPTGYGYEWSGTAYQEKIAGGSQTLILAMGIGFVFLFLAAQYESWTIPFCVLLGLPLGIFGAYAALALRLLVERIPTFNDVYAQIGIVMLMGLAAKNAILIVEFARTRHEQEGLPVREAATEAAQLRFRPILMTSAAFILGVLPLVTASGAGAAARRTMGTAVFGGMLAATALGVFIVPVLYTAVALLFAKRKRGALPSPAPKDILA